MTPRLFCLLATFCCTLTASEQSAPVQKPDPAAAFAALQAGNARFVAGLAEHPHSDAARRQLAGASDQGNYAYATVLACADSRVPVERIFDAGVMDLFTIRVAGNVAGPQITGTVEYGLAHVHTPVLVVMGHSSCGAVTAVVKALQPEDKHAGHQLERNIPSLLQEIEPAVVATMLDPSQQRRDALARQVSAAVTENVYHTIEVIFRESPATRELVDQGTVRVLPAVYDLSSGIVQWLPEAEVYRRLGRAETDMARAQNPYAEVQTSTKDQLRRAKD